MWVVLPLIVFFTLGVLSRRVLPTSVLWVKWINHFIIYVAFPAIIFNKVPALDLSISVLIPASFAWAWAGIAMALVWAMSRVFNLARETTGALLILTTMGNTSFLGYALTASVFGDATLAYAIFYDQFGSFFILSTLGLIIIARYTPNMQIDQNGKTFVLPNEPPSVWQMLKRIICFPPFITLCVAIFLPTENVAQLLAPLTYALGKTLMPLALFVIGLQFRVQLLPHHRLPLFIGLSLKMILAPILALSVFYWVDVSTEIRAATVFEAAMPSMITPGLLAISAGIAPRFIATFLGYSTVFALISLPIVVMLLL